MESAATKEFLTTQFARILEFVLDLAAPGRPIPAGEAGEGEVEATGSDDLVRREAARLRRRQILESIVREPDPVRWTETPPGPGGFPATGCRPISAYKSCATASRRAFRSEFPLTM